MVMVGLKFYKNKICVYEYREVNLNITIVMNTVIQLDVYRYRISRKSEYVKLS